MVFRARSLGLADSEVSLMDDVELKGACVKQI